MSRFIARGGQQPGYGGLWTPPGGENLSAPNSGRLFGTANEDYAFMRRTGIARVYERNSNLIKTLEDPTQALKDVNQQIFNIGNDKVQKYKKYQNQLRRLGFGEEEATARADALIARELENELSLLQLEYPYAVGGEEAGGWDPISAVLRDNNQLRHLPQTFGVIKGTKGLGAKA